MRPECQHLMGRERRICEGQADLPLAKINAYRERWGLEPLLSGGVELPSPSRVAAAKNKTIVHSGQARKPCSTCGGGKRNLRPNGHGPGSQLLKQWASMPKCDACIELAARMDMWGKDKCERNIDQIVSEILPRAKAWMSDNHSWLHKVLDITGTEDITLSLGIKRSVNKAIDSAIDLERKQQIIHEVSESRLPLLDNALSQSSDKGIVTGAKYLHWPCLGAIAIEAANQNLALAVADHGLHGWQKSELDRVGVRWINHDKLELTLADKYHRIPSDTKAWWKPWICLSSPFSESVWVDSDAVVTGSLDYLWQNQPAISTQRLWTSHSDRIYDELAKYSFGDLYDHRVLTRYCDVNSGVICWARGEPLIQHWVDTCAKLLSDNNALTKCRVRDQSGMIITLMERHRNGLSIPAMLPDAYNYPADGLKAKQSRHRLKIPLEPEGLLSESKIRSPKAKIIHWLGRVKPWTI